MDIHIKEKPAAFGRALIAKTKGPAGRFYVAMYAIILAFVVYKIPFLSLPFYWDEAWSYATAVFHLNDHGLLNPHPDLMRGHPMFFYILSALWIKTAGTTPAAVHILPLIFSCVLLIIMWVFANDFIGPLPALAAVIMFGLQSVFLAQSGMLLPEVLLSLLVITSLYFWIKRKYMLFAIFATMLVMTKETGVVIVIAIYIAGFVEKFIFKQPVNPDLTTGNNREAITGPLSPSFSFRWLICLIPLISFLIFMTVNRIKWGWFLYPGHTAMISADAGQVIDKSRAFYSSVFLQNGRVFFLCAIVTALILKITIFRDRMLVATTYYFIIITLAYGLFSAFNFFTSRYQLTVLPLYFITGSAIIFSVFHGKAGEASAKHLSDKSFKKRGRNRSFVYVIIIITLLSGVFACNTFIKMRYESDISVYYRDTVELHREVVSYATGQGWYDKPVYTAFLMQYNLAHPRMGYLSPGAKPFEDVSNLHGMPYKILIFCSNENDHVRDTVAGNAGYVLVKRFENKRAWAEIYKPADE